MKKTSCGAFLPSLLPPTRIGLKALDAERDDCYWGLFISTNSDYQIYLKRDRKKCFADNYIQSTWQQTTNYYKAVVYMTGYISKPDKETLKVLTKSVKKINTQKLNNKEAM